MLDAPEDVALCVGIVQHAKAVLSMRLHTLIFAAGQGIPCAGIVYDPKVSGFMDALNTQNFCMLEQADTEHLCALVDALIASDGVSAANLRNMAKENVKQAFALLEK